MSNNTQIIELLREHSEPTPGLDPGEIIAGAKRRRARRRLAIGAATMAAVAVTATSVIAAGGLTSREDGQQLQVAGSGGPSATPRSEPPPSSPIRTPRRKGWTPGGPIGAQPIGTIPASGKVKVADKFWFETKGTTWCVTAGDYNQSSSPCRGTIGNSNIGDETAPSMLTNGNKARGTIVITSVFRGTAAHRVIYTVNDAGKYYEGKLYRLEGIPGWTLSIGVLPWRDGLFLKGGPGDRGVFVYDENDNLIFPKSENGKPVKHPLESE